jgi:hypothetical protein
MMEYTSRMERWMKAWASCMMGFWERIILRSIHMNGWDGEKMLMVKTMEILKKNMLLGPKLTIHFKFASRQNISAILLHTSNFLKHSAQVDKFFVLSFIGSRIFVDLGLVLILGIGISLGLSLGLGLGLLLRFKLRLLLRLKLRLGLKLRSRLRLKLKLGLKFRLGA